MKVLVAVEHQGYQNEIANLLAGCGFEIFDCDSIEDCLSTIRKYNLQTVITSKMDLIANAKKMETFSKYIYCIAVECNNNGRKLFCSTTDTDADDYLHMPANKRDIILKVRLGRRISYLENHKQTFATIDALTGMWNDKGYQLSSLRINDIAERYHVDISVIAISIDNLELYSSRHGKIKADNACERVANAIRGATRDSDEFFRISEKTAGASKDGEGELIFVGFLIFQNEPAALITSERIVNAVKNIPIYMSPDDPQRQLTVSCGVSSYNGYAKTIHEVAKEACIAMSEAKNAGGDCSYSYSMVSAINKAEKEEKANDIL